MWPDLRGPLLNDVAEIGPGHPHGRTRLRLSVVDEHGGSGNGTGTAGGGVSAATAACTLTVVAVDYRGVPYNSQGGIAASTALRITQNVSLPPARQPGNCTFDIGPEHYRARFANASMGAAEKAYALRFTVAVRVLWQRPGGEAGAGAAPLSPPLSSSLPPPPPLQRVFEYQRVLCTPLLTLRSGVLCEDQRGRWRAPAIAATATDGCPASARRRVGNGRCDADLNTPGCYDGGDCCRVSCLVQHGHLQQLDSSGQAVAAHECPVVSDDAAESVCADPALRGGGRFAYAAPPNATVAAAAAAGQEAAGDDDERDDGCASAARLLEKLLLAPPCAGDGSSGCAAACAAAINATLCGPAGALVPAAECPSLFALVHNRTGHRCSAPRCRSAASAAANLTEALAALQMTAASLWPSSDANASDGWSAMAPDAAAAAALTAAAAAAAAAAASAAAAANGTTGGGNGTTGGNGAGGDRGCICTAEYAPVGCPDGRRFPNTCHAACAGAVGCTASSGKVRVDPALLGLMGVAAAILVAGLCVIFRVPQRWAQLREARRSGAAAAAHSRGMLAADESAGTGTDALTLSASSLHGDGGAGASSSGVAVL